MCLCVSQCSGLKVVHNSLGNQSGNREIPVIYLWFCCSHVSLNPGVLPPGRTQRKTISLSDRFSEMRMSIQEHFGPHQKKLQHQNYAST